MGRATITAEAGEGRYTIEVDFGTAEKARRLDRVAMRLYELNLRKTWQADLLADIEAGMPSLQSELDALILAYVAATKAVPRDPQAEADLKKQIDAKTVQVNKQRTLIQEARNDLSLTELQNKSAELERGTLEQLNVTATQGAWCTDYTEQATGPVATLEIPGESGLILIRPGAPAPAAADGALVAREMQSPAQVFWNAAVLPGWQKHLPTYRWGTITAIDAPADRCDLELATAQSSAQALNVNQSDTLANVPIEYMTCNSAAFEVGDRVVVQFVDQDWAQPRVIGFVDHPRACGGPMLGVPASDDHHSSDGPTLIWKNYRSTAMPDELVPGLDIDSHPGHITWSSQSFKIGTREVQLSWKGADSRYSEARGWDESGGGLIVPYELAEIETGFDTEPWYIGDTTALYKATSYVWIDGRRVDTGIIKVLAAAFHRPDPDGAPDHVVLRVCSDNWPQDGETRGMVVFDLVCPSDTPGGCTLAELVAASSLSVENTYPATDFTTVNNPPTGKWRHLQHPHFDSLGERLATTIAERDSRGDVAVTGAAFSLPSWAIVQRTALVTDQDYVNTTSYSGVMADGVYESAVIEASTVTDKTDTYLVAVDWLRAEDAGEPDDLVHVTLSVRVQSTSASVNDADSAAVYSYTQDDESTTTFQVSHSRHGVIKTASRTASRSVSGASGTASATVGAAHMFKLAFTGDLSRDAFAVGFAEGQNHTSYTVGGPIVAWSGGLGSTADQSVSVNNHRILYDVWLAGVKMVSGYLSGYSESYPTTGTTIQDHATIQDTAARLVNEAELPSDETITSVWTTTHGKSLWSSALAAPRVKFGHMAVAPERTVAYFGVHHWHGSTNLVIRNAPAGLPSVQAVPAYADGDHPTLAAPLFLSTPKHYP